MPTSIQRIYRQEFKALANPMSSVALQIVLLFAVACSQIFGGVSCCCLSRALLAGLTNSSEINSPPAGDDSNTTRMDTPKCPKCAAARASSASATPKTESGRTCTLRDDNHCRCAKVAASAGICTEPLTLNDMAHELAPLTNLWSVVPASESDVISRHDAPVRFGGRSWQSVACVWKN